MRCAVIALGVALLACGLRAETPDRQFSKASDFFEKGRFGEAAYVLRALSEGNRWSHGAQHNLGNVEWKVSRPGYAVLAWERAHSIDPFDRNTVANLRFARTKANLVQPERSWFEQYSEWLPIQAWLGAASLGLWGGVLLLVMPRLFGTRRADWHQGVAALLLAAFLLTTPAIWGLRTRGNAGVVIEDETPLRLAPTTDAEPLAKLQGGEIARTERERGDYLYIRAEGDRAGWVKRSEFAKIWP